MYPEQTAAATNSPAPLTTTFRALSLLIVTWMCVTLGVSWRLADDGQALLSSNAWSTGARNGLVWAILLGWVALAVVAVCAWWRGHADFIHRLARRLLPLAPLAFIPQLLAQRHWLDDPTTFLVCLVVVGVALERSLQLALEASPRITRAIGRGTLSSKPARHLGLAVVTVMAVGYVWRSGIVNVLRHRRFITGAYDLAIFDNMMWNAMHGHPFRSSIMYGAGPGNALAGHAEFAQLLFVPAYAIHPGAEALLWLQATLGGLGAITLFLFARGLLGTGPSVLLSLAYLLYAPLNTAQFYDFHWLTLATPFLFLEFHGLAKRDWRIVIPTTLVLWAMREDVAPGLIVVGLLLALSETRALFGWLLAISSALWFAAVKFAIMPYFGTWFFADLYAHLATPSERGYGSVIKTLLTNPLFVIGSLLVPAKLTYALHIVAPLVLVPLRRGYLAALLLAGAFFTVLTQSIPTYSLDYQYSTHLTAYAFAAVVLYLALPGVGASPTSTRRGAEAGPVPSLRASATLASLLVCVACHGFVFGHLISPRAFPGERPGPLDFDLSAAELARLQDTERLIARIPTEASVSATTLESPHASARSKIYAFGHSRIAADYLLIHPASFRLGSTRQDIGAVLDAAPYGLFAQAGATTVWKRGHQSAETPAALAKLRSQLRKRN